MDEKEKNVISAGYCLDIISSALERTIRRLWALCIILAALLAGSWAGFFWWESQFEYVTETTTQEVTQTADGSSANRFVGGDFHGSNADGQNN